MTAIVAADNVGFRVAGKALVDGVSLALGPGETAVVIGPNGAGKSTLARLMAGELRPSSGAVTYEGLPISRWPAWRLACKRAVLPQKSSLAFPFTVADVVRIGAETVGRHLKTREQDTRVLGALARADVADLASRDYQTLSGGEQQRVQFARVLCQIDVGGSVEARQLLILDEPTASLDIKHQLLILEEAAAVARRGCAVLGVLHDVRSRGGLRGQGPGDEARTRRDLRRSPGRSDGRAAQRGLRRGDAAAHAARPIIPLPRPPRHARRSRSRQQFVGIAGEAVGHEA